jgi:hypothetical protein
MWWEYLIVGALVAASLLFTARTVYRSLLGRSNKGCACQGCPATKKP